MNGARNAAPPRRGSSFGPGPRRGTDPEGGERSAWKGLTGPSGLNLDHARIPDIQRTVFDVLTPLVFAVDEPIPLSHFTSKCCDLLLPVLERNQELGPHEFKSQWGRLNEFVCPELARRAGLGDSGYNRETKTVKLDLHVEPTSHPGPRRQRAASSSASPRAAGTSAAATAAAAAGPPPALPIAGAPPGFAPRGVHTPPPAPMPAPSSFVPAQPAHPPPVQAAGVPARMPAPQQAGVPMPVMLQPAGSPGALPAGAVAGLAVLPPAPCAYCQGPHSMMKCNHFHVMLQSIYQAGYQQGAAAVQHAHAQQLAQPQSQTHTQAPVTPATSPGGSS